MAVTWIDSVLDGMRDHFTADAKVREQIASRMYEEAAEEWIACLPNTEEERSPRTGQWAAYSMQGLPESRLLAGGESRYQKLLVLVSCYGFMPREARELFGHMVNALNGPGGTTDKNNYHGTWGGKPVKNVRFELTTLTSAFSEQFRQAAVECVLVITVSDTGA